MNNNIEFGEGTVGASIKQMVYDGVLCDIINGVYPLDYVFNEKELVEKYNVSKSPVRDALIELCNEQVLRSIPRYGYEIVRITERRVREITQFRRLLEVDAFRENCRNYSDMMLKKIVDFNREANASWPKTRYEAWRTNIDFHSMLYSFTNNQFVQEVLEKSLSILYRAYAQLYWPSKDISLNWKEDYHNAIEYHMQKGDYDAATEMLCKDIEDISIYITD